MLTHYRQAGGSPDGESQARSDFPHRHATWYTVPMTTLRTIPVRPDLVLDFAPAFQFLTDLEWLFRKERSFEALASYLAECEFFGEPVPAGACPLTAALDCVLQAPARAGVYDEYLRLLWEKTPGRLLPLASVPLLDDYPGLVGFLYCLEDLRFLELSPERAHETTAT